MKKFGNLELFGDLSLKIETLNTTSGNINNFSVIDSSLLKLTGNNPILNGLDVGLTSDKLLILLFNGTGVLTIKNESLFSTPQNRIKTKNGQDIIFYPNEGVLLFYSSSEQRWNLLSKETEILILPGLNMNGSINQTSGFNNFSDGRTNLLTTVPLINSTNYFFDTSVSSFLRMQGGSNITLTLSNMSEGQTVKIIFESTGTPYSITWSPYILWGSSFYAGENNTLFPGDIPTPSTYFGAYDFYEITKIGGKYFGRASLDHL